ncbi:hypothetical protein CMV_018533 [Castanea mollissima]|uniref:Growth-regulating factor n=1 Tax=Castanea mollissima TaxID=60419 RepID=A0A8J4R4G3_9ROSI|nr:hypothetical protein CMV_018533 [Castanea mollissima]
MTQDTTRAIVNFFAFSSEIMHAALALSAFRFATRSLSNAAAVRACACFNSSLATSTTCSNRLNLVITIGYSSRRLNGTSMHGALAGARGPFTPSQWMELEHQALIYKYLTANMHVPSNLLIPIRKALDSAGFSSFTGGLLRPNTCKIRKARFLTSTRLASQISLKMLVEIKISSTVAQTSKDKIKVD